MVVAERNVSKKRRQAQNRAERAERSARAAAAQTAADERRAERPPDPVERRQPRKRDRDSTSSEASAESTEYPAEVPTPAVTATRRGSAVFSARHRNAIAASGTGRPARTHRGVAHATGTEAPTVVATTRVSAPAEKSGAKSAPSSRTTTRASSEATRPIAPQRPAKPLPPWLDRFGGNEPGGRWVMISFLSILLASVVLSFAKIVPEYVEKKGKMVMTGQKFTIWHFGAVRGLVYLLPPILVVGLSILVARPGYRRRSWNMALLLLVVVATMLQAIPIFIISIACLGWGCWQARKAALATVGGDPGALRNLERERRLADRDAMRSGRKRSNDA